jgi:hypothetical protein
MSADSLRLARDMRALAGGLAPVFADFEAICLDVGHRLAEAAPGLSALSQNFAAVGDGLQGPSMEAACRDLTSISAELSRYSGMLTDEERDFEKLLLLNHDIEREVRRLEVFVRTVGALVFTLKIEAAQLPSQSADMVDFANTLQRLAEQARASLDEYGATQAKLDATLRHSAQQQAEFKRKHLDELTQIAGDIRGGLDALSARRSQSAALLHDVAARSRDIGLRTGECVTGLQIGDSTRQRVEHVATALQLAADALEAPRRIGFAGEGEILAGRLAHMQRLQIEGALADFCAETDKTAHLLAGLTTDLRRLEQDAAAVFGGGGGGSFLEDLSRQLGAAGEVVKEGMRTRAHVDAAKASVVETMDHLQTRTRALVDMAAAVTMIGTNASLRSTRLGDAGRGITLVAAELRNFGRQIQAAVQELPPALARVVACVDRFATARAELEAAGLARLHQRLSQAIETFAGAGGQMTQALNGLGQEATRTHAGLELAAQALGRRLPAARKLEEAVAAAQEFASALGGGRQRDEDADAFIDDKLGSTYSMTSQRRIHESVTGVTLEAESAGPEPAGADAFML